WIGGQATFPPNATDRSPCSVAKVIFGVVCYCLPSLLLLPVTGQRDMLFIPLRTRIVSTRQGQVQRTAESNRRSTVIECLMNSTLAAGGANCCCRLIPSPTG